MGVVGVETERVYNNKREGGGEGGREGGREREHRHTK